MDIIKMLRIMLKKEEECELAANTIGGNPSCSSCPLYKEVNIRPQIEGYESISSITLKVSPCLLLEEIAKKVKVPTSE